VGFDNIDLDSAQGAPPPSGPFTLTQNQGGTLSAAWNFPLTTGQQDRQQTAGIAGPDAAALDSVANEFFYLSDSANEHKSVALTFSGLGAGRDVYVQMIGGDGGWSGDIVVAANGVGVGTWDTVSDTNTTTASIYAFDATADAAGLLTIDLTGVTQFSGVSGIVISGLVPEPGTAAALLGLGAAGLLRRRRRTA
jgi:hypothetical protein